MITTTKTELKKDTTDTDLDSKSVQQRKSIESHSKDIWTLIKEANQRVKKGEKAEEAGLESLLLFVGGKQCGKSTLISRFLDKGCIHLTSDDTPSPSVALEYTFGRRTRGANGIKDVSHIWELGTVYVTEAGATSLSDLINIPLNEANIHIASLAICVDLSKPEESLQLLKHFFDKTGARVDKILEGLESRGSKRPKALRHHAWTRFGADHPDKLFIIYGREHVKPFVIPVAIIGTKYDSLSKMESERRKLLCKTLRFIAHSNGASLLFVTTKDEVSIAKCRQLISHHAFKAATFKTMVMEHTKPLAIVAGQDLLSQIGLPPSELSKETVGRQTIVGYERWAADFQKYFPLNDNGSKKLSIEVLNVEIDFSQFAEPAIDTLRLQKDQELEKIRAVNVRKLKDKDVLSIGGVTGSSRDNKKKDKSYSRARASQMSAA